MVARVSRSSLLLAVLDAVAIGLAIIAAFALGSAVHQYDFLEAGHVMSLALPVVPVCIAVTLASLWTAGLYEGRAAEAPFIDIAGALAWAMAPLTFIAVYWEFAPEGPLMVVVSGFVLATGFVWAARAFVRGNIGTQQKAKC
jgi:hypothetical protein